MAVEKSQTATTTQTLHQTRREASRGSRRRRATVRGHIIMGLVCFFSLFPLYWMFENSLRTSTDASSSVAFYPESLHWENYSTMWNALTYPFHVFLINSFVMSALVTLGTVI